MVEKTVFHGVSFYETINSELSKAFVFSSLKNEFLCFWDKWRKLHTQLFKELHLGVYNTSENENQLNIIAQKFMTQRKAMISSFLQVIKNHPNYDKNEINLFKNTIADHDDKFTKLLKQILELLSKDLNKIQSHRKVTSAYIHSQAYLGG
ncbi:hypothetical protein [Silvanigrella aquatica]|uniref:Cdc24/Scd1 N-terminal domain-containing protein n=1 Tax=Silvanigrella aquatica TaxID=1915309 RepID=A0A1L4CZN9_9BACT|nr:hypothetical protein [Silvanigrella aquatica]APJ03405.1 hypothetical protein AXG55_05590 [Silvanigrella aquatica]